MATVKKKQAHKTKEQILLELAKNKDFQERMTFTRDVFYPALCKASKSIEDTLSFLGSINTVMMDIFLGMMKEKKLGELNIISKLDSKDEKYTELCELLQLFEDKSIFEAKSYFEGMRGEINLFLADEQRIRQLKDLPTKWIDQV